jgi:hypothetical protein
MDVNAPTTLENVILRKSSRSSADHGRLLIKRICLSTVDLPEAPAPRSRSLTSFWSFFSSYTKRTQLATSEVWGRVRYNIPREVLGLSLYFGHLLLDRRPRVKRYKRP